MHQSLSDTIASLDRCVATAAAAFRIPQSRHRHTFASTRMSNQPPPTKDSDGAVEPETPESLDPQVILANYKEMTSTCQNLASKISELNLERDEHKLVIDTLSKLEPERKAFRLVGGVLVERTVKEVLPAVTQNYDGIKKVLEELEMSLKSKDTERKAYKEKHGIMTQEERERMMKQQQVAATRK